MRRFMLLFIAVLGMFMFVPVRADEPAGGKAKPVGVTASVDVASAYLFRGATQNDGWVVQPNLEIRAYFITLGTWANYDINDYKGAIERGKFSEVDIYAMCGFKARGFEFGGGYRKYLDKYEYILPEDDAVYNTTEEAQAANDARLALRQEYPRPELEAQDADELSLSVKYPASYTPFLSVCRGINGSLDGDTYIVTGVSHEYYNRDHWRMGVEVSASYLDQSSGESALSHCTFLHTLKYKYITATIGYVGIFTHDILKSAEEGGPADIREWGSVRVSRSF